MARIQEYEEFLLAQRLIEREKNKPKCDLCGRNLIEIFVRNSSERLMICKGDKCVFAKRP